MKLTTDFRDYYDHAFELDSDSEFVRMTRSGPNRIEMFQLLKEAGIDTPPTGKVGEVIQTWWEKENRWIDAVIVYDDLNAHCGEGKRFLPKGRAKQSGCNVNLIQHYYELNQKFCCAYVGGRYIPQIPSVSWRSLHVGPHRFWIEYTSTEDWRSNYGEGDCSLIGVDKDFGWQLLQSHSPIIAIDYVFETEMYAVDFNIAPGIRGSGVERLLSPQEVFAIVKEWHETNICDSQSSDKKTG